jgi:S-DNA-T family DNA segregation ATPase FtsK/SpoIIIE
MKSVISSAKFQQSEMELPIALGKILLNETCFDLAKCLNLLMAGATGQGKSVFNVVLTSLYTKTSCRSKVCFGSKEK